MTVSIKIKGNNSGGGPIAARDNNITTYEVDGTPHESLYLRKLYELLKTEKDKGVVGCGTWSDESLEEYVTRDDVVIGLAGKLESGGISDQLESAERAKERYWKKLQKHQLSDTAQKVHVYLLSAIESKFHAVFTPKVDKMADHEKLHFVKIHVIDPIKNELGLNDLDFTDRDLDGMLYFLTGKCLLKWSK